MIPIALHLVLAGTAAVATLMLKELWGYRGGQEWIVSHYLLEKNSM